MVLSDVSIKRPVFATVISLLVTVLGLAAFFKLPVREFPAIDPPIVSVTTVYKGASNEVVEGRITEIIEGAVSGIEGVKSITSQSREERSQVTVEFRLTRNVDAAASDVRDRVARVRARLPEAAEDPVVAKVDSDARSIIFFSMSSDRMNQMELTDFARRNLVDKLSIVPGVAQVFIAGERRFSMRIWIDRQAVAARQITVEDIEQAIKRQNIELPSGRIESTQRELTVKTDSRLSSPEQFRAIVVSTRGGYPIRLGEVAKVEIGPEDSRTEMRTNGRTAIGLGILRQSTANTLEVADGAKAQMQRLRETFPEGMDYIVSYDESVFIKQSIFEVFHALSIGVGLVVGVIFFFLRSVRATIIPTVAIPVSIIGSFTVLAAMGFSLNVLTLLALVLAIGIVVDDAIVVLENIHRRIEHGEPPLLAALRGARQIAFAVIATSLTLIAVFVPISFMEGNVGRLFTEFGIALAASVMFSALVALSLTPMMCSKLLKEHEGDGLLYRVTEPMFLALHAGYRLLLRGALAMPLVVISLAGGVSAVAYALWTTIPKELTPPEDRGAIWISVTAPEGASLAFTREQVVRIEQVLRPLVESGQVQAVMANIAPGFARPAPVNQGNVFVRLKTWNERTRSQQDMMKEITPKITAIPGVFTSINSPGTLGQRGHPAPIQFVIGGTDYETLRQWRDRMLDRMRADQRFVNATSSFQENKPELRVRIDRLKAADLGVSIETIGKTLETLFGSREVNTYVDRGEEYKVIMQARAEDRATPRDLASIFVRSATTQQLIPLSNVVTVVEAAGPQELNRVDRLRSITLRAGLVPGFTIAEGLETMERFVKEVLPPEVRISYQGQSREFKESSSSLYVTFLLALVVVFLVLAAQFESWIHPLIIMLAVPLAVTGGLGALWFTGISLNIYSQIGMILLIGLMTKNGILIVEFANQLRDEGKPIYDAVLDASVARLRPILMTSIATAFGAVPLAFAYGAGAESRSAIGWVIIGGVSFATMLTSFVIPALYLLLARFTRPVSAIAKRLSQMESEHKPGGGAHVPAE
ncbi:MAG: efflux RND transporter permease subunit [Alphaproteobacteria bacterium]|nr:efflux RND transporter permease subunit [Alphaproteobacteria bacterium]